MPVTPGATCRVRCPTLDHFSGTRTASRIAHSASFGAVLLKEGRLNAGVDETALFSVNNVGNGPPSARILNPEFYQDPLFDQDSLDLRLLIGDPEWGPVDVTIAYDAGGEGPLEGVASFSTGSDTVEQLRRIGIAGLPNSNVAVRAPLSRTEHRSGPRAHPRSRRGGRRARRGPLRRISKAMPVRMSSCMWWNRRV